MVPLYRHFARDWEHCLDFSDDALYEMYDHESRGIGHPSPTNGFYVGKRYLNVAVASWCADMFSTLWPFELYEDETYPHWWLDKQFPKWCEVWRERGWIP